MNKELFECVPNVSEGRDRGKIEVIAQAVRSVPGVRLLHVDSSFDANRTVFTFVGDRNSIVEGAYALVSATSAVCDMRTHQGIHPRQGAVDVCPFVPLAHATLEDCVDLAQRLGVRVWRDFHVPVYLYANAANRPERVRLENIRRGQYEGLREKLYRLEWQPDIGEAIFNERLGAIIIGARKLLIAFNVNLQSSDVAIARKIASRIRESGGIELGDDGVPRQVPGLLPGVKAIGWFLPHLKRAQISTNIVDFEIVGLHEVYEACKRQAKEFGTEVTGSELVGLVPKAAMVRAASFYAGSQVSGAAACSPNEIALAAQKLNLSDLRNFNPQERILEDLLAAQ